MLSRRSQPTALWLFSAALLALTASALPAQNETPPAAAAAESVQLAFKHAVGQSQKFRGGGKADLTLTLGQGGLGPIPLGSKLDFVYTQKVAGTRAGTGTLSYQFDRLNMDANALGMDINVKAQNGKVTTLMNGAPPPPGMLAGGGKGVPGVPGMDQITNVLTVKRDPRGITTLDPAKSKNQVLYEILPKYLQFPDKPVSPGESWETALKFQLSVGAAPAGPAVPEIELKLNHTLKAIEIKGGRRHAIITTEGSVASAPPAGASPAAPAAPGAAPDVAGTPAGAQIDLTATTRFDVDRGAIISGQMKSISSVNLGELQLPAGAAGALGGAPGGGQGGAAGLPGGAGGLRIDGESTYDFSEIPVSTAKPAAKSKAKPRAKTRKK